MSEPSKKKKHLFSRNKTLAQGISRDPISADLLFLIFASTVGTQFYDSQAPQPKEKSVEEIVKSMSPMQQLASYSSDEKIKRAIGAEATSIFFTLPLLNVHQHLHVSQNHKKCMLYDDKNQHQVNQNVFNSKSLNRHKEKKKIPKRLKPNITVPFIYCILQQ